jgi:hypothetical protein
VVIPGALKSLSTIAPDPVLTLSSALFVAGPSVARASPPNCTLAATGAPLCYCAILKPVVINALNIINAEEDKSDETY